MPKFDASKYVTVQDRINLFWEEYPNGAINTEMKSDPDDFNHVVFKASVFKDSSQATDVARPDSTGWAAEERADDPRGGANFTSWHENGETSSIGRALANMGYATSNDDRPSREEMEKVNRMIEAGGVQASTYDQYQERRQQQYSNGNGNQYGDKPRAPVITNDDGVRMPTPAQLKFLGDLLREQGEEMPDTTGMTFNDCRTLIEQLKENRTARR